MKEQKQKKKKKRPRRHWNNRLTNIKTLPGQVNVIENRKTFSKQNNGREKLWFVLDFQNGNLETTKTLENNQKKKLPATPTTTTTTITAVKWVKVINENEKPTGHFEKLISLTVTSAENVKRNRKEVSLACAVMVAKQRPPKKNQQQQSST